MTTKGWQHLTGKGRPNRCRWATGPLSASLGSSAAAGDSPGEFTPLERGSAGCCGKDSSHKRAPGTEHLLAGDLLLTAKKAVPEPLDQCSSTGWSDLPRSPAGEWSVGPNTSSLESRCQFKILLTF